MATKKASKKTTAKKTAAKKATAKNTVIAAPKDVVMPPHTAEFAADLTEVFKRHGWSGLPQQLSFSAASGCNRVCDNGSIAQPVWLDCPGGIRKMVCACPGEDPSCDD
jgi:hypothetical protein